MKTYRVTMTEKLQMTVEVETFSRYEAEQLVEDRWKDGDYIPLASPTINCRAASRSMGRLSINS